MIDDKGTITGNTGTILARQMSINKGRNRNTAWFAAIDKEWKFLKECFVKYLKDENFGTSEKPIISLSELTKPILYKLDNDEFV